MLVQWLARFWVGFQFQLQVEFVSPSFAFMGFLQVFSLLPHHITFIGDSDLSQDVSV